MNTIPLPYNLTSYCSQILRPYFFQQIDGLKKESELVLIQLLSSLDECLTKFQSAAKLFNQYQQLLDLESKTNSNRNNANRNIASTTTSMKRSRESETSEQNIDHHNNYSSNKRDSSFKADQESFKSILNQISSLFMKLPRTDFDSDNNTSNGSLYNNASLNPIAEFVRQFHANKSAIKPAVPSELMNTANNYDISYASIQYLAFALDYYPSTQLQSSNNFADYVLSSKDRNIYNKLCKLGYKPQLELVNVQVEWLTVMDKEGFEYEFASKLFSYGCISAESRDITLTMSLKPELKEEDDLTGFIRRNRLEFTEVLDISSKDSRKYYFVNDWLGHQLKEHGRVRSGDSGRIRWEGSLLRLKF